MEGLLNKARRIRGSWQILSREPALDKPASAPAVDLDQADIIRQIELAVSQNKTQVTPELFNFKARNNGLLLPLLVNGGTVLVLAIAISIFALIFASQQKQQESIGIHLKSAEGTVIAELKKEADAKMAAKEKEIGDINSRLSQIAAQRDNLSANMEATIAQREAQLRKQMQGELETERARLKGLGLGEDEINKRMKAFEKQKNDEFNAVLATVKKQADDERKRSEDQLKQQETTFSQNLAQANQDRATLAADSKKREDELRSQLQAEQSRAAAQANLNQGQLSDAQQQISRLAQAREQEKSLAAQLAGFYATLRDQLGASNWSKAAETIGLLKTFLNSQQIADVESMRQRRETELFVADSLMALIDKERAPTPITSANPVANQEALAAALKAAQDQSKAELEKAQKEADAVQKKLVEQKDAELAKQLKQQAAELNTQMDGLKQNIREQAVAIGSLQESIDQQKSELAAIQAVADANAKRAETAETNLKLVSDGKVADLVANQKMLEGKIAALDKEKTDLLAKATTSSADLEIARNSLAAIQQEHKKLTDELAAKDKQLAQLRKDTSGTQSIADSYDAMVKSWNDYLKADAARMNPIAGATPKPAGNSGATGINALMNGKLLFDSFLTGNDLKKTFPGLYDRVHALDAANIQVGKDSVLPGLADKLYDIASFGTRAERLSRLKDEIRKANDASAKEFYQNLYDLISLEDK